MAFKVPKGWAQDDDKLFIHTTGIRIHNTTYKEKKGWFLIPVEFEEEVVGFDGTAEGRDKAFEHWLKVKEEKAKAKAKAKPKRKPRKKAVKKKTDDEEEPKAKEKEEDKEIDEGDED